ncbi:hypothetical protein Ahy_A06g026679 [Arachis hypogaea]|uniref:Uncharacterized protein n=1 Tax=Arachis hypogaea TaxID=3818 RepID=A0A445CLA9_ARAHY|nr:hypothetical protein Ahy_A06g026679 [Arachis hypogaea]
MGPIQPTILKKILYISLVTDFFSQFKNLEYLIKKKEPPVHRPFFDNHSGPIPRTLSQLPKPGSGIIRSHNELSGPIPVSLGQLDPQRIDLRRNKLAIRAEQNDADGWRLILESIQGRVPKELDIIYDSIPAGLTAGDRYNRLCGEIPQGGKLQKW